ncbi:VTT domain-containing protein [Bradyrhizobium cytisi]|uniref:TVP38/TMEM64 family membrane protein n=1 Tax=Bradyrhizobium cytisi TaxID=515489 RepID=A0A5S4W1B1_9BRAD|nr:VTT domain-containing protein [Bradyrhizobium cytisi]TYL70869.1 TVP38/TMEM64 family protein [Bradyrhizobium cytisi]
MRGRQPLIVYVAAVVFLTLAYFASPVSREAVWHVFPGVETTAHAHPLATALVFLVTSAALAFLAFPSMPMICLAAGFYMDGLIGGATVLLGSAFGGLSAFLFYRKQIQRPSAPSNQKSAVRLWLTLLGLRLSPLVPAPLVNVIAAVFDVSPLQYLTTSMLGGAPLVLFYAQIGQQGHHLLSGETLHWQQFSGYLILLTLSTLLSAIGPWRSVLNDVKKLKSSPGSNNLSLHSASGL